MVNKKLKEKEKMTEEIANILNKADLNNSDKIAALEVIKLELFYIGRKQYEGAFFNG